MTEVAPDSTRVPLGGVLNVRTIASVRASLIAEIADRQTALVDCSAAENVDLCFIQLLLAGRLSARQAGKQFLLAARATSVLLAALEQAGFLPPAGADLFWSGAA